MLTLSHVPGTALNGLGRLVRHGARLVGHLAGVLLCLALQALCELGRLLCHSLCLLLHEVRQLQMTWELSEPGQGDSLLT